MGRDDENGRNPSKDVRNSRSAASKLCAISTGGYFNNRYVRGIVWVGHVGGFGDIRQKQEGFFAKEFGIEGIPSKAVFARVLSMINGKETGDAILDILHMRFGTEGEVIAVDGKAICCTSKAGNPHRPLQILSAYVTENGVVLAQEAIHEKTNEIPVFFPGNAHLSGC